MITLRPGTKFIKEFSNDEPIVSMIEFKHNIYVATSKRVYIIAPIIDRETHGPKEVLVPIEIAVEP